MINPQIDQNKINKVSSFEDFIRWISDLDLSSYIFRGQANHTWPLRSAAARRICGEKSEDEIKTDEILFYILDLISRVIKKEYHLKVNTDYSYHLKILADLQHHGAATNLIDFSKNALIALWFACCDDFCNDGKVFAVDLLERDLISEIGNGNLKKNIDELLSSDQNTISGDKSKTTIKDSKNYNKSNMPSCVWAWTPGNFDNRILSQSSIFLFGIEPLNILTHEAIIASDSKKMILETLNRFFNINEETIYSDFIGFAQANSAGKAQSPFGWKYYFEEAKECLKNERYSKSLKFCSYALKLASRELYCDNNKLAELHLMMADNIANIYNYYWFARSSDTLKEAISHAGDAIDILSRVGTKPKFLRAAYLFRGFQHSLNDDYESAINDYNEAESITPNDCNVLIEKGCLKLRFDKRGAVASFKKALKLTNEQKTHSEIYSFIADYYIKHNKTQKAIDSLRHAIKLDSINVNAMNKLAKLLSRQKKYIEALEMNEKILDILKKISEDNNEAPYERKLTFNEENIKDRIARLKKYKP